MSKNFRSGDTVLSASSMNINDLLMASRLGAIKAPLAKGRRARKRASRKKMMSASLLAPLLAAEGCLSVGKEEIDLGAAAGTAPDNGNNAGGVDVELSAVDDHVHAEVDQTLLISESQLLSNDLNVNSGGLEIVRVFDAVNGTVFLENGNVRFVPNTGFEGVATFSYEVQDADGSISTASVEVAVGGVVHGNPEDGAENSVNGQSADANAAERKALLDLAPESEATHVAVQDGSWFDPNTWANGEVPPEGAKVFIPQGIGVLYDGESTVSLFTVRVDGQLDFATDQNTFMEVDTLIVATTGKLTIGTAGNPVAAGVEAVIQIADNGPIDVAWDTQLLSRGVVSQGAIEIYGAEKDTYLKVAIDAMAGDTSLTLEAPPEGWSVGDRLVLTGTKLPVVDGTPAGTKQDIQTEDEELIITAINGNVITFDRPLEFDHDTPRADLKAYVANYTRNIRFITENADDLPVYQRGHVMFMQSDDVDVRYAEFTDLGRTDKSERAFDVANLDSVEFDTNVKARYPLHIHRAGVGDQDNPAELVGNAVWNSPGWGLVQHDSNAIIADNAVYDAFGAAFVAETGNETGRWVSNIAIKSIGLSGIGNDNNPKLGSDVAAFDLGRTGAGFWFQSRMVDSVDNVAAGIPSGQGFIYFSRGPAGDVVKIDPDNSPYPESLNYADEAQIYRPSISQFVGNEAFAVGSGFYVVKPGPNQRHDLRSVIEDFTAWETRLGIRLEYTGGYTLKDIDLIGAGNGASGLALGNNAFDLVVNNANITGFDIGVIMDKTTTFTNFDGDYRYVFIDVNISGATTDYTNIDANDLFLTAADLVAGRLEFVSGLADFPLFEPVGAPFYGMNLPGVKTDSIGSIELGQLDPQVYRGEALGNAVEREGYWTLPDGRAVTVFERYFSDRATGELIKQATFIEIPGGAAWAQQQTDLGAPIYHGVLDVNSAAPVATDDSATVSSGSSVIIDALANDFDPDGDAIAVDGFVHPTNGRVDLNDDGTITYTPDPNFTGMDQFWYWVEDDNGNFAKGEVYVTVDV
ncbi:MAG: tandem-95 repeat protein [Alphaproteobacteria bacterium]|nr:tandem-95 repeat protein [Alphaproteobacteria bacterium]